MTAHSGSHLLSLYPRLLRTAESPTLTPAHGAAAMNALCGYIEQGCVSSIPSFSQKCFGLTTWKEICNLFFERSENNKPKPMRQVLLTLMHMRSQNLDQRTRACETKYASSKAIDIITCGVGCSSGKPAFQILEHFLSKGVITALQALSLVKDAQSTPQSRHSPKAFHEGPNADPLGKSDPAWAHQVQRFISDILSWVHYPDTAAAAGRLLSVFLTSLQRFPQEHALNKGSGLSLCIDIVKQTLKEHPDWFEPMKNYVMPTLFATQPHDTLALLQSMPLLELIEGNIGKLSDADIEICMLLVEVAEDSSIPPNIGTSSGLSPCFLALEQAKLMNMICSCRCGGSRLLSRLQIRVTRPGFARTPITDCKGSCSFACNQFQIPEATFNGEKSPNFKEAPSAPP